LFIPGFGNVATPQSTAAALAANPGTAATAKARSGVLGTLANPLQGRGVQGLPRITTVTDTNRDLGTGAGSTGGVSQTFAYPTTLPALTPQQQEALLTRRRLATRGLEETQALVGRERQRAEADELRRRQDVFRQQEQQSREGMQTLAGRGVARSPMFTNPFQRQLAERSQREVAELQSGLGATLEALEGALRQAEIGRDRELAQIDFDAGSFRSDIDRLLGA
jgi:hypothetical protein